MVKAQRADVALFGATGFTGALVAEALIRAAPPGFRLVLAGRNPSKLEAIRARLESMAPGREISCLVADKGDAGELETLARSARVVVSTVGPFAQGGLAVVEACVRGGAHYADITGETTFIRDSIDRVHADAEAAKLRIVHGCGFDSIPSDLGVWMLHEAEKKAGRSGAFTSMTMLVEGLRGGFSGGTVESMVGLMDEARRDPVRRRLVFDPYALSPDRSQEPSLGDERDDLGVHYEPTLQRWTAPFVMAAINTRVVRRTNALLGYPYGKRFRYREVTSLEGSKGAALAVGLSAGTKMMMGAMALGPTRKIVRALFPKPGEGLSPERIAKGHFAIRFVGKTEEGVEVTGHVEGHSDPGYGETSKMLAQSALALAFDEKSLTNRFGVLTPATAFGSHLVERLRAAGMVFEVEPPDLGAARAKAG